MNSFLVLLALAAFVSYSTGCFMSGPVCGRQRNSNSCRRFMNVCKYNMVNRGQYERVGLNYCSYQLGSAPCLITDNPTTVKPPTTPWTCGTVCTPMATQLVCAYQVNAATDTCRTFRNQCEFENYKCQQSQPLYQVADISRCNGLAPNVAGPCV
ncbi:hypothetical protein ACFFRR_002996 [Megaselia abdita]